MQSGKFPPGRQQRISLCLTIRLQARVSVTLYEWTWVWTWLVSIMWQYIYASYKDVTFKQRLSQNWNASAKSWRSKIARTLCSCGDHTFPRHSSRRASQNKLMSDHRTPWTYEPYFICMNISVNMCRFIYGAQYIQWWKDTTLQETAAPELKRLGETVAFQ